MELSIVLPCYKEAENLKHILPQIITSASKLQIEYEILIIDSLTKQDHTEQICRKIRDRYCADIRYIQRRGGDDYGDAVRTGIEEVRGRYFIIMDGDGSHDPKDIAVLYKSMKSKRCLVVIGSRYISGGETDNNLILKFMSWILNVCYRFSFGLYVKDVSDSYRIYVSDKMKKLTLVCSNFDIVEEILIKLHERYPHGEMREIPIHFKKRLYGESKRELVKFIFSYLDTMKRLKQIQRGGTYSGKRCEKKEVCICKYRKNRRYFRRGSDTGLQDE